MLPAVWSDGSLRDDQKVMESPDRPAEVTTSRVLAAVDALTGDKSTPAPWRPVERLVNR